MQPYPRLAVASLATSVFVSFGISLYAVSVLITEEGAGSEFSIGLLSGAFGGAAVIAGLLAPRVGRHADDHSVRGIAATGAVLGALGMVMFAAAHAPWQVIAAFWLLVGPATAMTLYEPAFIAVGQWVHGDFRNRAIAMLVVIGGLAGPVFVPATGLVLGRLEWRSTAVLLAGLYLVPAALAVFAYPNLKPRDAREHRIAGVPWRRFVVDRRLLFITVSIVLTFAAMQTTLFHRVALFEEHGYAVAGVAALAGLSGLLTFPGRYLMPRVADRARPTKAVTVACTGLVVAMILGIVGTPLIVMVAFFVLFGLFFGILIPTRPVIMNDWYAGEDFGAVMGKQWALAAVVGGVAPWLVGVGRDAFGSYTIPFAVLTSAIAVAGAFNIAAERVDTGAGSVAEERPPYGQSRT
jgi:MFS family permease